jgi:transcriptional regulator with XRE-family HTH domain
MITIEQVQAARKLLGWSQDVWAVNAGVSQTTVAHFETGKRVGEDSITLNLLRVLECAGIEFAADEARVTLRKKNASPEIGSAGARLGVQTATSALGTRSAPLMLQRGRPGSAWI